MNAIQALTVGLRIASLMFLYNAIASFGQFFAINHQISNPVPTWTLVVPIAIWIAVAVFVWLFAGGLARVLLSGSLSLNPAPFTQESMARTGICLLGLWVLTIQIPDVVRIFLYGLFTTVSDYRPFSNAFQHYTVFHLVELSIGLLFVFKHGLVYRLAFSGHNGQQA
jgi:hypothetical protein